MTNRPNRMFRRYGLYGLSGLALFVLALPVQAQTMGSGSSSGGGSGSSGGGSFGGGLTSFGGGSGGSSSGGSLLGGSGGSMLGGSGGSLLGGLSGTSSSNTARSGGSVLSPSNLFASYYANPMAVGITSNSGSSGASGARASSFGSPLYGASTSGSSAVTAGVSRGASGVGGSNLGGGMNAFGSGGYGQSQRLPAYIVTAAFPYKPAAAASVRSDLQEVIGRSTSLTAPQNIQVVMEGPVVVLRGIVPDERERRLAENMLRLSPGVRGVRNELAVRETGPMPRATP